MKSIHKSIAIFLIFVGVILIQGSSDGRAFSDGWGNTGAPGDETLAGSPRTCQSCHSTGSIQVAMKMTALNLLGDTLQNYIPEDTISMHIDIQTFAGNPAGYGFQMVSLQTNGEDIKGWINPGNNVRIATAQNTGRLYAEHNGISDTSHFEVQWIAPQSGTGPITFYSCGNGVNKNGIRSGDGATLPIFLTLQESIMLSSKINDLVSISVYPNPAKDRIFIESISTEIESVEIFDLFGRSWNCSEKLPFLGSNEVNISTISPGMYYIMINKVVSIPLIKL